MGDGYRPTVIAGGMRELARRSAPGSAITFVAWPAVALVAITASCGPRFARADVAEPVLSTYVGIGEPGIGPEGESRFRAAIAEPYGLACDDDGNLYVSDYENNRVARADARTGEVTTLAEIIAPQGLALDGRGHLYVGSMQGVVWGVDLATGSAAIVAGGGTRHDSRGLATELALEAPAGVNADAGGHLYIADAALHAILRLDLASGQLEVVAGRRGAGGYTGDGGPALEALLDAPSDVAVHPDGSLYIADADNHVIRAVDPAGTIRTIAGTPGERGYAGDGAAADLRFDWPQDLELHGERGLLVADVYNHRVRELDLDSGAIRTIAGNGSKEYAGENLVAASAALPFPVAVSAGPDGAVYVSSPRTHRVFRIGAPSVVPVPWWQSPWTWLGAFLAFAMLLASIAELRARQLRVRARALEAEVANRTLELARQRETAQQQADRLAALAATKDRLLARISGEFRTPLEAISASAARLPSQSVPDEGRRHVEVVERNTQRLLRLVDQMIGLTRGTGGKAEAPAPLAVRPLLAELVESFETVAAEQDLSLTFEAPAPLALLTTRNAFETIVVNLVSNAIKYTPRGGHVTVTLAATSGMGVLEVRDTGRGIAPADHARVFQPFERAHDEGERIPGSGLGLALVRELAGAQGGRVELDSAPGRGTTVRVSLPLAGESSAEVPATAGGAGSAPVEREIRSLRARSAMPEVHAPHADARCTVLVVEDNADMRRDLLEVLSPHYRCLATDDGEQAILIALREVPDLVVSDVMLPGRDDGIAVCAALKADERTSHVPVVLLTALEDREHRLSGLAGHADDYLAKPFSDDELLLRLRNLLDLRGLLQRRYARDLRFERRQPEGLGERDRTFLEKLGRLLDRRHADPALDAAALAAGVALSERQLQRKLRALTGLTPGDCLRDYRLQRAHERLLAGERVGEVAAVCGFASPSHFAACFRARYGCTPSEARERARQPA